jgi:predicted porin
MKKSLIALAVAGTFAAPAAFAATANVDVYGLLNVAVEHVDNGINSKGRVTTGNNSALGFKGSEDLGGGLKGIWQVETNVSLDGDNNGTGTGPAGALNGTRNTFLGLSGGFGTVLMGVHDTPYKLSTGRLDNFVGTLGDYNSIMGAMDNNNNASVLFDLRASNVVAYVSPNIQGFQARLGYVFSGESNFTIANIDKSDAWSLDATYTNGPLFLTGAYEKHNLYGGPGAGGGTIVLGNGTGAKTEREAWKIGAGYKFGDLSVGAIYENIEVSNADRGAWMLNAGYAMGPITLKAMYMNADDRDGTSNTGAKQWNLGVDYALSKRTTVQFVYANLDNDSGAAYQLGQGSNVVTGTTGKDQDGFAIGVRHSF